MVDNKKQEQQNVVDGRTARGIASDASGAGTTTTAEQQNVTEGRAARGYTDPPTEQPGSGRIQTSYPSGYTMSYDPPHTNEDIIRILKDEIKNNPIETLEQRKKREKRERLEKIISGISDAVSAVSNLYFTSRYAPNAYNPKQSMSAKSQARWDKAKAERDKNLQNHLHYAIQLGQLQNQDWQHRRQAERDRLADERWRHQSAIADAKEKRAAQLHDIEILFRNKQIDASKAEAKRKEIEAQYAEELNKAKVAREQAAASANQARANNYKNGGSGGKQGEYPWYDKNGKLHYARDYGAMRQNAIMHGTWIEEEDRSTVENSTSFDKGKRTETNTTTKKKGEGRSTKPGLGWGKSSNNETDW